MAHNLITRSLFVLNMAAAVGVMGCSSSEANKADDDSSQAGTGGESPAAVYTELRSEVVYDKAPEVGDEPYATVLAACNDLGIALLKDQGNDGQNAILSPVSLGFALGMLAAGAESTTLDELTSKVGGGVSEADFHGALNRLSAELRSRRIEAQSATMGDREVTQQLKLEQANGLWLRAGLEVEAGFLDQMARNYDAGALLIDFTSPGAAEAINGWVEERTEGSIPALVSEESLAGSEILLTDTLYFLASWARPFDPGQMEQKIFHAPSENKSVTMVRAIEAYAYAGGEGWQMLDIPYVGGEVAFSVILPDEGKFDQVRARIDDGWLADAREDLVGSALDLSLPIFAFDQDATSLREPLQTLGLAESFDCGSANFSRISQAGDLCLKDVPQAAHIGLDEMGTEASAATASNVEWIGLPDSPPDLPIEVVVDRPFLFVIRDASGALLFVGQVMDPEA